MTIRERMIAALQMEDFALWLYERGVYEAGTREDAEYCPLATYLRERGGDKPRVTDGVAGTEDDGTPFGITLPQWAKNFINELDNQGSGVASGVWGLHALIGTGEAEPYDDYDDGDSEDEWD